MKVYIKGAQTKDIHGNIGFAPNVVVASDAIEVMRAETYAHPHPGFAVYEADLDTGELRRTAPPTHAQLLAFTAAYHGEEVPEHRSITIQLAVASEADLPARFRLTTLDLVKLRQLVNDGRLRRAGEPDIEHLRESAGTQ